ncbi:hypothetical protein V6N13_017641 [Hibiscus sabdariffa]|uniref:Callose synthase helical domain-containing protein n=2 Tax=Hibiscus sabdariffa TaxID=183260 RepID=A0ABR2CHV6_9ROSI
MVLKVVVSAAWMVIFAVCYAKIWQNNHSTRWTAEADRRVRLLFKIAFAYVLPELLALTLVVIPWMRNFIEQRNWMILDLLFWWFQSKSFVGRRLWEGPLQNIKYTLFWAAVLATKFAFSYFLQIKPMVRPSKLMLNLRDVEYEFFGGSNRLAVGLLWLPVVFIYLMDIQIWYSIYSSFVGAVLGLLQHLGEIRNIQQLKLRFQFFANAIQFNLMPEEQLLNAGGTFRNRLNDSIHRFMLRYGLEGHFRKLESNQVETHKFALIWNEIITIFREEDIISDSEVELLELPPNSWNVRVIRWPCFLLCNELLLALSQAKELVHASDQRLWYKICKNEYRRCAVIEAYDSFKHLMLAILRVQSEEQSILTVLFQKIDHSVEIKNFTKMFRISALPQLHMKLIKLTDLLTKPKKDVNQVVNTLRSLYDIAVRDFFKDERNIEQLREDGLAPHDPAAMFGLLFENAVKLPDPSGKLGGCIQFLPPGILCRMFQLILRLDEELLSLATRSS